jgi:hypothetical protein
LVFIYLISTVFYYFSFVPIWVESINIQAEELYIFRYFSIFVFIIPSIINAISVLFIKKDDYPTEGTKITLINDSGGKVITIISILLATSMVIASNKKMIIPPLLIKSVAISISLIIIGVIPLYWIECKNKIDFLIILRHIKTCFFLHALSWLLASLILLIQWFLIEFNFAILDFTTL